MKKHISFPSIEQFRNIVATINRQSTYTGLDENGEATYNHSLPKPILVFKGSVKLHGTNAGVCYNSIDGIWSQSKENIITPEQDNAGFAFFLESNKDVFIEMMSTIFVNNKLAKDDNTHTVSIYGEWCGGNIQKGVGITNLAKSFFIFGVKITPHVDVNDLEALKKNPAYWVDSSYLRAPNVNIFNISDYQTWEMEIDFNSPESVQNKLGDLTLEVENECPVAKAFGFSGIGEGIVWSCEYRNVVHRFKVKGVKHSPSKVKTLASVDIEKINSIKEFVDYAVTENRFNQGLEKTFLNNEPIDVKKIGSLMKWIVDDIIKEEMDTMVSNKLEPKDIGKYVSNKVREMFFKLPV